MYYNMKIHIPNPHPVQEIFTHMHTAGYDIRIVGGYVRDRILHMESGADNTDINTIDIDLATPATPETVHQIFTDSGYKVLPIGIKHGTVQVVMPISKTDNDTYKIFEITTLRQDIQTDGRHAVVRFTHDWATDAQRRDFTINSLYADIHGTVYDYCGGVQDIWDKKIRFIGNAKTRIKEDALRILRFWRFVVKTGWNYDTSVLQIFQDMAPHIRHISYDRIRDEMIKMLLYAHDPCPALWGMYNCGVIARIVPFAVPSSLPLMTEQVATSTDIYAKIIALCNGNATHIKTLGDVWGMSNAQKRHLQHTITIYNNPAFVPPMVYKFLYYYGYDTVYSAGILKNTQLIDSIKAHTPYKKPLFPVSGSDLIQMGIPQGAKLGGMLKFLESWWVDQKCTPKKQDCLIMALRLRK